MKIADYNHAIDEHTRIISSLSPLGRRDMLIRAKLISSLIAESLGPEVLKSLPSDYFSEPGTAFKFLNKILGQGEAFGTTATPVDGFCVRVGAMRCHSQALTFKLKKDVPVADIEAMIAADNAWVQALRTDAVTPEPSSCAPGTSAASRFAQAVSSCVSASPWA